MDAKQIADPMWRMSNLYQIRTKMPGYEGKTITFQPNDVQREIYQKIEDGWKRVIILKPRKLGTTTGCILYLLDKAMYSENQMCRTIAHRKQTVSELFNDIARFAFDRINPEIRPAERYTTRSELQFKDNGSKYSIDVEARGMTPSFLHFSEIAYIEEEAKLEDTLESLPLSAVGIAESTANGKGNWFERTFTKNWETMKRGNDPEWYPLFYSWFDDPMNVMEWTGEQEIYHKEEVQELKAKYKNKDGSELGMDQLLWWDRKKWALGDRMPELYPSCPDEAFMYSTGKVYPEFSEALNVIPPVRYDDFKVSFDYGQTNPMCFLLIHQDSDGNHIVFDEFYKRECPIVEAAKWLKKRGIKKVHFADPSVHAKTQVPDVIVKPGRKMSHRKSIADLFKEQGIYIARGTQTDVLAGVARVKQYLKFDPERLHPFKRDSEGNPVKGSPRLFFTENCVNTIGEFPMYLWPKDPQGALNRSAYENPIKANDHAMDCIKGYALSHCKPVVPDDEIIKPRTPRWFLNQMKNRGKSVAY